MINKKTFNLLSLFVIALLSFNRIEVFAQDNSNKQKYITEKIIVLVVDGPRYSETWGDKEHKYIPHMAKEMARSGIVLTNFYNDGYTYTTSGHAAICTGVRKELENRKGTDLPDQPSVFQYYLKSSKVLSSKAWVISSKDKLFILGNCKDTAWKNKYNPSTDCGIKGPESGYREDSITFNNTMKILKTQQPNLLLVNFREPDYSGHANDWKNYIKGIRDTDSMVYEIWKFIQSDSYYKGKTTLFVTNDHGRHLDGWEDGFVSHGDSCEGCRHINLFAFGPDFKQNNILNKKYVQVDLTATIAELLNLTMPYVQGKIIKKLFK